MATTRKFCRFNKGNSMVLGVPDTTSLTLREIPDGGFCLSSFLVATLKGDSRKVLMGAVNPEARWDHVGALDEQRTSRFSKGWMLPSSHMIYGESPIESAERLAREQIGLDQKFGNPLVASDSYVPKTTAGGSTHWDLEFIFRFELEEHEVHWTPVWTRLEFVDYTKSKAEIVRSHEDVLHAAGL